MINSASRVCISLDAQTNSTCGYVILHGNTTARVVLTPTHICVGCTDVEIKAAKYLVKQWEEKFGELKQKEYILQS